MRTFVYVDGFNLYYGSLKNTNYKWLNIDSLCKALLKFPNLDIIKIRYFTAPISARTQDPQQPIRQETYLRALKTLTNIEVHLGSFLSHPVTMVGCDEKGNLNGKYLRVLKTEEKGSDVNIASYLLLDAFDDLFDQAIVITNDSDLVMPIQILRKRFNKRVGLINPQKTASFELKNNVDFVRTLRKGALGVSQFPNELRDAKGIITKPASW